MNNKYPWLILIISISVISFLFITEQTSGNPDIAAYYNSNNINAFYFPYLKSKDTIHFLGNEFIEIRLKEQKAYLIRRNDSAIIYKISTGNANIEKGKSTPAGLFTVQTKSPLAISKQFDNAELYNWIGFNGNIGFHGLKKTGYYASLGIRPSSHGCVRIGKESGADMYKRIRTGTPVIVYYDKPAVEIAFSNINDFNPLKDIILDNSPLMNKRQFAKRIRNLERGLALRYNIGKFFLDGSTILKPGGYEIGSESALPSYQLRPLVVDEIASMHKDNLITLNLKPLLPDSTIKQANKSAKSKGKRGV